MNKILGDKVSIDTTLDNSGGFIADAKLDLGDWTGCKGLHFQRKMNWTMAPSQLSQRNSEYGFWYKS